VAFLWICGLQTIVAYLILSRVHSGDSDWQARVRREMLQRENDLIRTRDAVIFGLAKITESRDPDTGDHLERIARFSTRLASALRCDPRFRNQVSHSFVKLIGISSVLHDIGKVGVPDSILKKPGKLDEAEYAAMRSHVPIGRTCIREIELRLGNSNFLHMAEEIAFCHHERWDGTGYPRGLAGAQIPLAGRIVAIADAYDAATSRRVYKAALSHEDAVANIRHEAGKQFDPNLVDVFLQVESDFQEIALGTSREESPYELDFTAANDALDPQSQPKGLDPCEWPAVLTLPTPALEAKSNA
jgi:response regulator RpfG family c-di-GMP phosphodiesterase